MSQRRKAQEFLSLHQGSQAFILPNAWDVVSARLLEQAGFQAIATASAAIAWAAGVPDGEEMSREEMIAIVGRIVRAVNIPVSADLERGYGDSPEEVGKTIEMVIEAGAVGANLEDSDGAGSVISPNDMVERITAARQTIESSGIEFVLNARVDMLIRHKEHEANLDHVIDRANAYLDSGANCIYVLTNGPEFVPELAASIRGPLNILGGAQDTSLRDFEKMGVKRVTIGPYLLGAAFGGVRDHAREMLDQGTFSFAQNSLNFNEVQELVSRKTDDRPL
ncbi:MAG: isocitrate lyase/phosphoenolpyruvate mutase family protein [bacterium]|nr:isocitrate lyase/phosphoenolpyruvate mutase family protein [bacterium]